MTTAARQLLAAFEALDPADKQEVAAHILRRVSAGSDLQDDAFDELAGELFRRYETEESSRANDQPGRGLAG
jgi:hypothetical protein